jgi:UDP-N-acetylmuramate dehydrogenase
MHIREQVSLKKLNTFGIDEVARYGCSVSKTEELEDLFSSELLRDHPHLILGGGSNILLTGPFPGVMIHINTKGLEVIDPQHLDPPPLPTSNLADQVFVRVQAGELWDGFVSHSIRMGWGGLENLSLIPGQAGTSPMQNIGAYGAELKDCFHSLEAFEKDSGKYVTFNKSSCRFGYRDSFFKREGKNRYVITSVTFVLSRNNHLCNIRYGSLAQQLAQDGIGEPCPASIRNAVIRIRESKLPDPALIGNAGSFFKNPIISHEHYSELRMAYPDIAAYSDHAGMKVAAAWLIEKAGWKGYREGDAGVHHKQALVIVNHGLASGSDILQLSERIRESVYKQFMIELIPEVNII